VGEEWQRRMRTSFTFRDRLAHHAIAADCSPLSVGCCLSLV
jgi:hypothetical protein